MKKGCAELCIAMPFIVSSAIALCVDWDRVFLSDPVGDEAKALVAVLNADENADGDVLVENHHLNRQLNKSVGIRVVLGGFDATDRFNGAELVAIKSAWDDQIARKKSRAINGVIHKTGGSK